MSHQTSYSSQIGILDFWHKIEFFTPFNLKQELETKSKPEVLRTFGKKQLWEIHEPSTLWDIELPIEQEITGFNLYLAMFDHKELTNEVNEELIKLNLLNNDDFFENSNPSEIMKEGDTCFAKLKLNANGVLIPTSIEVSASPWAIGKIRKDGFNSLDFTAFDADISKLKHELSVYYKEYLQKNLKQNDYFNEIPLNGRAIIEIIKKLFDWAGYQPNYDDNTPLVKIQAKIQKRQAEHKYISKEDNNKIKEENNENKETQLEISILNSFYARDILKAIRSLEKGIKSPVLEKYLGEILANERINLFSETGIKFIYKMLSPKYMNIGHWFSEPFHKMSLMQQFAINTFFNQIDQLHLFSVNGPPGTGKTTLLRDIFAENIVQRAKILSSYSKPKDVFIDTQAISFITGERCKVSILHPGLTGFEMIVASSNNSAVENISKELPQLSSLGSYWKDKNTSYLQPVVRNIVAQRDKSYELNLGSKEPWGLFSVALGKKDNRNNFVSKFYNDDKNKNNFNQDLHQSIWNWRKQERKLDYKNIREKFISKEKELAEYISHLETYHNQYIFFKNYSLADYVSETKQKIEIVESQTIINNELIEKNKKDQKENNLLLENAIKQHEFLSKNKPNFIARILNTSKNKSFNIELNESKANVDLFFKQKQSFILLDKELTDKKLELDSYKVKLSKEYSELTTIWHEKKKAFHYLEQSFSHIEIPNDLLELNEAKWQIDGVCFDEKLNTKRSELFSLALQLHEAWIYEVLQNKQGFGGNLIAISHLLSGKKLHNPEQALSIWQSLFMIIPVVSTTFAAFATQFCDLGSQSLGWLFIDEAGQAAPQMAVGALWRAKRAMVVGDPLQIEPVVGTDPGLIEALKQCSQLPKEQDYSPNKSSVQNLADWANPFGIEITSEGQDDFQWLGSPLRVHRRCVEPMFSIANEIAYESNMIYFNPFDPEAVKPPKNSLDLGESAWVQITGEAYNKHIVKSQIELVHKALLTFYLQNQKMPPVYIISPFKKICNELITYLKNINNWHSLINQTNSEFMKNLERDISYFCNHAIGTVHTFQGKEQSIVWMILGCDRESHLSAEWAASKPNLLNVALTRAKHRFFMIGDTNVWGTLPYFQVAKTKLAQITPQEFIDKINNAKM